MQLKLFPYLKEEVCSATNCQNCGPKDCLLLNSFEKQGKYTLCPELCPHLKEMWKKQEAFKILSVCEQCDCFHCWDIPEMKVIQMSCKWAAEYAITTGKPNDYMFLPLPEQCQHKEEHKRDQAIAIQKMLADTKKDNLPCKVKWSESCPSWLRKFATKLRGAKDAVLVAIAHSNTNFPRG